MIRKFLIVLGVLFAVFMVSCATLLVNHFFFPTPDPYFFLKPTEPISVPIEIYKKGATASGYFWIVPRSIDEESWLGTGKRLNHELTMKMTFNKQNDPGEPDYLKKEQQIIESGLIKSKIYKIANDGTESLFHEKITKKLDWSSSWGYNQHTPNERYQDYILDSFKTEYGLFRFEVEVLQNIPELNNNKIKYSIEIQKSTRGK